MGRQGDDRAAGRSFATGIGRGFGGALVFALPMLMTLEMWDIGVSMDRGRLLVLLVVHVPVLVLISCHAGFERTLDWAEDARDAMIAYAVGIVLAAGLLAVFGVIAPGDPADAVVGKVALQSVPASIGALLARSQLGQSEPAEPAGPAEVRFGSEVFLMGVGALFLGLNVAPTEEMVLISYMMTPWHALGLVGLSVVVMHGFVYAVAFRGEEAARPGTPWWDPFLRFTLTGYAAALAVSLYVLWIFGRTDGHGAVEVLMAVIVLGFPAAVGAAAARLIL